MEAVSSLLLATTELEFKTMKAPAEKFKRGTEWPNEGFVQSAIEAFFRAGGFEVGEHRTIDLVCSHPVSGVKWRVEAKGLTSAVGLDFRTGLGQLIQGMEEPGVEYALAVPDIPQFRKQVRAVPTRVVEALKIHWLFVQPDGSVKPELASGGMPPNSTALGVG